MQKAIIGASLAAFAATAMPTMAGPPPWAASQNKEERKARKAYVKEAKRQARADWRAYRNYDYDRYESGYSNYYADRYYRPGSYYQDRYLGYNDRIYRGQDGRYYCRRSDGTTGLIVGGLAGGVLGNLIAPGGSKLIGSLIGGGAGAVLGRAIDRRQVRCD